MLSPMRKPASAFSLLLSIGAALAILGGAGCKSSDLSADINIPREVAEALPTDAPAPTDIARAIWYPHASGFGTTDDSSVGHASGVLSMAGDKLWFMSWNDVEHHFDVLRTIPFLDAKRLSVAHFGGATMLVIESDNLSFDSFELMTGSRISSDQIGTEALFEKLQALRWKRPPADR